MYKTVFIVHSAYRWVVCVWNVRVRDKEAVAALRVRKYQIINYEGGVPFGEYTTNSDVDMSEDGALDRFGPRLELRARLEWFGAGPCHSAWLNR